MSNKEIWFPARRYGWGWGLPLKWQGWVVLALYCILLGAGAFVFQPEEQAVSYFLYICILSALLVALCWLKGERPSWRWGGK